MNFVVEDLGVAGQGEAHLDWEMGILARHPRTQSEYVVHPSFEHGFLVIDPRARSGRHVQPDFALFDHTSRSVAQGADGAIYSFGMCKGSHSGAMRCALLKWDWEGNRSLPVAEFAGAFPVVPMIECDREGHVYGGGQLYRIDPRSGAVSECLQKVGWLGGVCGRDRLWYAVSSGALVCQDPRNGATRAVVGVPPGIALTLKKDGAGRVIIPVEMDRREGRVYWLELVDGKAVPVDASAVRLAETVIGNNEAALREPFFRMLMPYVFEDGSYLSRLIETEVTHVDATGRAHTFSVERKDTPLRLFSIQEGGGKLWMSSILPLVLLSYDPPTGTFAHYRTPTHSVGEIYSLAWCGGRLFMACYPRAHVTRYDPAQPWRWDDGTRANPAHLGPMKRGALDAPNRSADGGLLDAPRVEPAPLYLHRPYGKTMDTRGNVYFSAAGDYGCVDSGLCRIDRHTEAMTRWIYPDTAMTALTYLPQRDQLLVFEARRQEPRALRFTFVSPEDGRILDSHVILRDEGRVIALLHDGGDLVYGLHDVRGAIFAYSLKEQKITASLQELGLGHHCYESLAWGPDGRIWGLTRECVFAVTRDLTAKERLADYPDFAEGNFYRFGFVYGPDRHLYFANGAHLMRLKTR
ncbi:MAG: hypothetical protein HY343_11035 [Lentisphaerae bacterium]|nr:hypothetical protein [Lentisphaerota bacterium]